MLDHNNYTLFPICNVVSQICYNHLALCPRNPFMGAARGPTN